MHSGYPMMGLLDVVPEHLNASGLRRFGTWGIIHEIGHNQQMDGWSPRATVETGCNFFSLYVNQNVNYLT
jgi:hypothetical protein